MKIIILVQLHRILEVNIQYSICMRILFPFIAYRRDDLCWKIRDYFQSFGKGCRIIIRRTEFLEEVRYMYVQLPGPIHAVYIDSIADQYQLNSSNCKNSGFWPLVSVLRVVSAKHNSPALSSSSTCAAALATCLFFTLALSSPSSTPRNSYNTTEEILE